MTMGGLGMLDTWVNSNRPKRQDFCRWTSCFPSYAPTVASADRWHSSSSTSMAMSLTFYRAGSMSLRSIDRRLLIEIAPHVQDEVPQRFEALIDTSLVIGTVWRMQFSDNQLRCQPLCLEVTSSMALEWIYCLSCMT